MIDLKDMRSELKPCPFCGGKAVFNVIQNEIDYKTIQIDYNIKCDDCSVSTADAYRMSLKMESDGNIKILADSRSKAVASWNRRPVVTTNED